MQIRFIAALFLGGLPLLFSCASLRPDPSRLAADVAWMADDAREGRRAGTKGESATTEWLAARLESLGLEPAGEGGDWFQSFSVPLPPAELPGSYVSKEGGGSYSGVGGIRPGSGKNTVRGCSPGRRTSPGTV